MMHICKPESKERSICKKGEIISQLTPKKKGFLWNPFEKGDLIFLFLRCFRVNILKNIDQAQVVWETGRPTPELRC
jgi:hypothetical protein